MITSKFDIDEEIQLYYNYKTNYSWTYKMWTLLANADRIINNVYLFKHFDDYCWQLGSDRQKDKLEVYWAASYNEKLIDYIKIIIAFETMNKSLLLKEGILIHKIDFRYDKKLHKKLHKKQTSGIPITLDEFYNNNSTSIDWLTKEAKLTGLTENYATINFSHTLNKHYQEILKLDEDLVHHLKEINQKRNKLHFYSDFTGAFDVSRHIAKWKYIKESSLLKIRSEFLVIDDELKSYP